MSVDDSELTVVVVNYNGSRYIEANTQAIQKQTLSNFSVQWIDNHSTDDSVRLIRRHADSRFVIVEYPTNEGPIQSMANVVYRGCGSKYLMFLNVATVPAADCFETLLAVAKEGGSSFGGCFPQVLGYDPPFPPYEIRENRSSPTGRLLDDIRVLVGHRPEVCAQFEDGTRTKPRMVETFWGLACMLSRDMLLRVQLDTTLFNYGEEEDISRQAEEIGYRFYFVPSTWIRYARGAVTNIGKNLPGPLRTYLSCRNEVYLASKYLGRGYWAGSYFPIVLRYVFRSVARPQNLILIASALGWNLRHAESICGRGSSRRVSSAAPDRGARKIVDPVLQRMIATSPPIRETNVR